MLNLHHGRIPEYRGGPPAFWEIYNRESEMGVSVHHIDDALDHGPVMTRGAVPIHPTDDPKALMERAYEIDADLVSRAIEAVARGEPPQATTDDDDGRVHTLPSRSEVRALSARLGRRVRHDDFRRARLPIPS
jgi:methionyl-tRNA formyltransferase